MLPIVLLSTVESTTPNCEHALTNASSSGDVDLNVFDFPVLKQHVSESTYELKTVITHS